MGESDLALEKAIEAHRAGDLAVAERGYRAVLERDPQHAVAMHLLGVVAHDVGKSALGAELIEAALSIIPNYPEALANISDVYATLYRLEDAETAARKSLQLRPGDPLASLNLGVALGRLHRDAEALPPLRVAMRGDPSPRTFHNISILLQHMGMLDEAMANAREAYQRWPDEPSTVSDLADLKRLSGTTEAIRDAEQLIDAALIRWPGRLLLLGTASFIYFAVGRIADAERCIRQSLEIDPDSPASRFNHALLLMSAGDYQRGWEEYEYRLQLRNNDGPWRKLAKPLWHGEPMVNKTLLVYGEQGFGDTLMFARFVPRLAQALAPAGCAVRLLMAPCLSRLMRSLEGPADVSDWNGPLPDFDYHVPLMSLARIFQIRRDTIPSEPVLKPPAASVAKWKEKLAPLRSDGNLQVGLVWNGRPQPDPRRTCPLPLLAPLADVPQVTFHSLQTGLTVPPGGHVARRLRLIDQSRELTDFAETAALIENLDLTITIDTAAANLAGATGANAWVLLPTPCDWRWGTVGQATPWYPSLRLFRQESLNEWANVVSKVVEELKNFQRIHVR